MTRPMQVRDVTEPVERVCREFFADNDIAAIRLHDLTRPLLDEVHALLDRHAAEVHQAATLAERERVRKLLTLPGLQAVKAIPDGEIRNGCVVLDGGQVRANLKAAYRAIVNGEEAR